MNIIGKPLNDLSCINIDMTLYSVTAYQLQLPLYDSLYIKLEEKLNIILSRISAAIIT